MSITSLSSRILKEFSGVIAIDPCFGVLLKKGGGVRGEITVAVWGGFFVFVVWFF